MSNIVAQNNLQITSNSKPEIQQLQPKMTSSSPSQNDGLLHCETLQVQNKRYYFDIKEHLHGRFLKLAETGSGGRKSRMVIPAYLLPEVDRILTDCLEIYEKLEKDCAKDTLRKMADSQKNKTAQMVIVDQASGDAGAAQINRKKIMVENHPMQQQQPNRPLAAIEHHHEILERGKRRYYFNLKENSRGRYLRVKASGDIPQTFPGVRRRIKSDEPVRAIILPAAGIERFRNTIRELNKNHGVTDISNDKAAITDRQIAEEGREADRLIPSAKFICKDFKKVLFCDIGTNSKGTFARITEQQRSHRETTTIPAEHFEDMIQWMSKAFDKMPEDEKENISKIREARNNAKTKAAVVEKVAEEPTKV